MKSVLLVTQHYWPEPIGSAPYLTDLAEWLAEQGSDVRVLTCRPHYPDGIVPPAYRKGRRDSESRAGVLIERLPPFRPAARGVVGRVLREGLFLLQGLGALVTGRMRRNDHVISLCPSVFAVLLGIAARRRGGRHVVLVHDIQSGLATGLRMASGRAVAAAMRAVERFALNRADAVVVLSDNMRERLRAQGVNTPIEILPIWVDAEVIQPSRAPRGSAVQVVYSGNLGKKQGLDQIVEMAEELEKRESPVNIVLRGEGSEARRIAEAIEARKLGHVHMVPLAPPERLSACLAEGAIHLVPQDVNAADCAVPSKAYSIMASGRPFVATAQPGSQLWDLCERSGAFICVPAGDAGAIADAVETLARDPALRVRLGRNGRRYVLRHHDKSHVLRKFQAMAATPQASAAWQMHPSRIS